MRGLIQALAVHRKRRDGAAEPPCRLHNVCGVDAADCGGRLRRVFAHRCLQRIESLCVSSDECVVAQAFRQHHVQHPVVKRDVSAGQDRQKQIGCRRGIGATRIDHDDFKIGPRRLGRLDATKQNWVRKRRVGTGDEQAMRAVDIGVTGRRRIGTQRHFVTRHRRRHAQARIGIDVVSADQALGEFIEDVIVLGQQLPGNVKRHTVRTVFTNDVRKPRGGMIQRRNPVDTFARRRPRAPPL